MIGMSGLDESMTIPATRTRPESSVQVHLTYPAEEELLALIQSAEHSISFAGPGMSTRLATAIVRKDGCVITLTVDLDPEVCRIGFAEPESIEILERFAASRPGCLKERHGLRVCMLTVDRSTIVFPPAPRLVEAPMSSGAPAIVVLAAAEGVLDDPARSVPSEPASTEQMRALKEDLHANPPLPFDLARRVRIFNAQFEFVEFELTGTAFSRKRVPVPSSLMGLSKDSNAKKLIQSTFRLIGDDTTLADDVVLRHKKDLMEDWLIVLPKYGTVILRAHKPRFERRIAALRRFIGWYQKRIEKQLEQEMHKNQEIVCRMLFPLVKQNLPSEWRKHFIGQPADDEIRRLLQAELARAFGRIAALQRFIRWYQKRITKQLEQEMQKNQEIVCRMLFPLVKQNLIL